MLVNESEFNSFKSDYYGVSMNDEYYPKSGLGKHLGGELLQQINKNKNVLACATPIGQIIGKQDVFGSDNNEVNPETKFKIKWSTS